MRRWFDSEIELLREYAEVYEDGLLVVDVLHESDAQPTFRTLVQVDGDVLSMIGAGAAADPEFANAYARHMDHVAARLRALVERPRRWTRGVSMVLSGVWTGLVAVAMRGSGMATLLVGEVWDELLSVAGGFLMGALVWPLGRMLLREVVARRLARERSARTKSVLARLTGQAT